MVPMYPSLAGQHAQYLENAIKAYRDGQRTGGNAAVMAPMAEALTDADIANLAAFFSQQNTNNFFYLCCHTEPARYFLTAFNILKR